MPSYTFWRLHITGNVNHSFGVTIAEWKFFDAAGDPIATSGGTASASNSANGAASNAFDGNVVTFWGTDVGTDAANPQWLQYEFASAVDVATFSITTRTGSFPVYATGPDSWELRASPDGVTWVILGSYSARWISSAQVETFPTTGHGLGTMVRLSITATPAILHASIAELRFYDGSGELLSLGSGASSASSIYNLENNGSAAAFDGDEDTYWSSFTVPDEESPQWIAYRFAGTVDVVCGLVSIKSRPVSWDQSPSVFSVEQSHDGGETWATIGAYVAEPWTEAGQVQTFSLTQAKRVRGSISPEQIQGELRQGTSPIVLMARGEFTPGNLVVTDGCGNAVDSGISEVGAGGRFLVKVNGMGVSTDWVVAVNESWPPYSVNGMGV